MKITRLKIPEVILIKPNIFEDTRGFFYESYNSQKFFSKTGIDAHFVQDNHSKSVYGVLRGLHYQIPPAAQGKLVRVISGEVLDVAVDLRRDSPSFGKWVSALLSAENKNQLWIPSGFAHAFLTLSQEAEFLYKTTNYYSKEHERCIMWNDPTINIKWPIVESISLSEKDKKGLSLYEADLFLSK